MLEDLEPGGKGINTLSAHEGHIVETDRVNVKLSSLKPGTINGYLGTYEKFVQFVVEKRVHATEFPLVCRSFRTIVPNLKGWKRIVDLEGRVENNQQRMNKCTYRLKRDNINMSLSSSVVVSAKKIHANSHDKYILSIIEMCKGRDYLITLISLKTGTHPGSLENMKVAEYLQISRESDLEENRSRKIIYAIYHVDEYSAAAAHHLGLLLLEQTAKVTIN